MMFQIHPADVGPGCVIVITDKNAVVWHEIPIVREDWVELCNNPDILEDVINKAVIHVKVATAREEAKHGTK